MTFLMTDPLQRNSGMLHKLWQLQTIYLHSRPSTTGDASAANDPNPTSSTLTRQTPCTAPFNPSATAASLAPSANWTRSAR
jgi:hypothetical protein